MQALGVTFHCLLRADSVEKLRFVITGKFLRIFLTRAARFAVAFSASEVLRCRFLCTDCNPLISGVQRGCQIANRIVVLPKSEYFHTIGHIQAVAVIPPERLPMSGIWPFGYDFL